jgi:hypothetical protein
MELPKNLLDCWLQVEAVHDVLVGCLESELLCCTVKPTVYGTNLEVFPPLVYYVGFQVTNQTLKFRAPIAERLAIVREWQGDPAVSCKPAADVTEEQRPVQISGGRGIGKRDRLIPIRAMQHLQPFNGMVNRGMGMLLDKTPPSAVAQWVHFVHTSQAMFGLPGKASLLDWRILL